MTGLATALGFLTRLPVGRTPRLTTSAMARAAVWFPVVGVAVGAIAGGVRALAGTVLPAGPATVLALLAAVLVTGGLHEDGLADTADAFGAHADRPRRLEILHDSRVGTFGALAVAFALLFAYALLAPLDAGHFLRAAVVGHALGRWTTLPLSLALPPAAGAGAGTLVRATPRTTAAASACAALIAVGAGGPLAGAVAIAASALVAAAGGAAARRVLGGVTGDVFGAVNKLAELAAYAALVAAW